MEFQERINKQYAEHYRYIGELKRKHDDKMFRWLSVLPLLIIIFAVGVILQVVGALLI